MIHNYKGEPHEIQVKLIKSDFMNVKEHLFALVQLSLLLNQFLLYVTFQYPLKSSSITSAKHWKEMDKCYHEGYSMKLRNSTLVFETTPSHHLVQTRTFLDLSLPHVRCVHKIIPPSPTTYTHYHHLTHNAFKYLSKKSYQTLINWKTKKRIIASCI